MRYFIFRTVFVLVGMAAFTATSAQTGNEFYLSGSGGWSALRYSVPSAAFRYGFGGSIGAGFGFFFHPQWEASLGLEAVWAGSRLRLSLLEDGYRATDGDVPPKDFEFRYAVHGYRERQNISLLSIPLTVRYHFGKGEKMTWYAGAGIRAGFPLRASYTASSERLEARGGYTDYDDPGKTLWFDHPADAGFGVFENVKGDGSYRMKTAWMATVEAGVRLPLNNGWTLSAGPYLDYGLNNTIKEAKDGHPVTYTANTPTEPVRYAHRSLLVSSDGQGAAYAGKTAPVMAGVRVRLSFGDGKKRPVDTTSPIFVTEAAPEQRPEESPKLRDSVPSPSLATIVRVTGKVVDASSTPLEAQIFATDNNTHQTVATVTSRPEDGSYSFDLMRGHVYSITATAKNHLLSLGKIDLTEYTLTRDSLKNDITMLQTTPGASVILHSIHFDFNQTVPNAVSIPELEQIVLWLQNNPSVKAEVAGHTDNMGNAEVNRYISELRAKAVCDYLIGKGIAADRLSHVGYGLTKPIADNATNDGRAQNRRVELTVKSVGEK
ncbi:MAG: OmpA family protein [Bacteroidales bacterium]|jgi:outer membrane protein OmpA-like peptidoglycan-associated protein|nr:OmpA family protein [Bacteroidales bacterium]